MLQKSGLVFHTTFFHEVPGIHYSPSIHCLLLTLQGYGSFLLRDLPFDAIQFCIYEQLRMGYKLAVSSHMTFESILVYITNDSFTLKELRPSSYLKQSVSG